MMVKKIAELTVECKLAVSDETVKACRNLLDIYNGNNDRPPRIDGGTVVDFVEYLNRELPKYVHNSTTHRELQDTVRRIAKDFIEEYGE